MVRPGGGGSDIFGGYPVTHRKRLFQGFRSRRILGRLAGAAVVVLLVFLPANAALGQSLPATAPQAPSPAQSSSTQGGSGSVTTADYALIAAQSAAGLTIPTWSGTVSSQGTTYPYRMVGKSPFVHHVYPRVGVDAPVISIVLHFPDGTTSDPTKPTGCGTSTSLSPQQLVAGSPVFRDRPYTVGGVYVGTGQYVDEFQRANFWSAIKASNNPDYGVRLRGSFSTVVTLSAAQTAAFHPITDPGGPIPCGHVWGLDAFAVDNYLQHTVIPSLGLSPTSFPIFLGTDTFGYVGSPGVFDVTGSHGSYKNAQGVFQTYAEVTYGTTGFVNPDVSVLAHEVGEWMDDPFNNNLSPVRTGFLCESTPPAPPNSIEVGDPLGNFNVTVGPMRNHVTYHPQELAFFSWFYNQVPSQTTSPTSYSSNGTFQSDSANTPFC